MTDSGHENRLWVRVKSSFRNIGSNNCPYPSGLISGAVTEVKTDIYVTSFGPVSDVEMVSELSVRRVTTQGERGLRPRANGNGHCYQGWLQIHNTIRKLMLGGHGH